MPRISDRIVINSSLERALESLFDITLYGELNPAIEDLRLEAFDPDNMLLDVQLAGKISFVPGTLKMQQKVKLNFDDLSLQFWQTDGYFSILEGKRTLTATDDGITLDSVLDFEIAKGIVGRTVHAVAEPILNHHVKLMQKGLKDVVEQSSSEVSMNNLEAWCLNRIEAMQEG